MEEEILYTGSVDDITALVAAFTFPSPSYLLLESMPPHVVKDRQNLLRLVSLNGFGNLAELKNFTSGRVFGKDFELRWERALGKTRVVFLGAKAYQETLQAIPELIPDTKALQNLAAHSRHYYLFGQLLATEDREHMSIPPAAPGEEYYAEVRIPRLLHYPDLKPDSPQKALRLQLAVQEYADTNTGQVKLFRFSGLRAAE